MLAVAALLNMLVSYQGFYLKKTQNVMENMKENMRRIWNDINFRKMSKMSITPHDHSYIAFCSSVSFWGAPKKPCL